MTASPILKVRLAGRRGVHHAQSEHKHHFAGRTAACPSARAPLCWRHWLSSPWLFCSRRTTGLSLGPSAAAFCIVVTAAAQKNQAVGGLGQYCTYVLRRFVLFHSLRPIFCSSTSLGIMLSFHALFLSDPVPQLLPPLLPHLIYPPPPTFSMFSVGISHQNFKPHYDFFVP